jgi:hypothetical protein
MLTSLEIDGERAYRLLRQLGPARLAGSAQEGAAASMLMEEIRGLGLVPGLETFSISTFADASATLEMSAPDRRSFGCVAIGCSGSTPPEGIEAPLIFVETAGPSYVERAQGKLALVSTA